METDFEIPQEIVQYWESKPGLNFGIGIGVMNFGFDFYSSTLGGTLNCPEKLFSGSL